MFVGVLNYYEQGAGIYIVIKTGSTIQEIKEGIDDYFLIGMSIFPMKDVVSFIDNDVFINHRRDIENAIDELDEKQKIENKDGIKNLLKLIDDKTEIENKEGVKELLFTLETYCPVAYKNLMAYKMLDINFEYKINLS